MQIVLCLIFGWVGINANPVDSDTPAVEPEYLSALLNNGKYEEFAELMNIPDPELVKDPSIGRREIPLEEAMFHEKLIGGDIVPIMKTDEEGRQAIDFGRYPGSRWPNRRVPYVIHNNPNNNFTADQRRRIQDGINHWNNQLRGCIELQPRRNEEDYVFVISGNGCWSFVGKTGKQQALSLNYNGCIHQSIILHEFEHAIGIHHEHNRLNRDEYVEVLWNNIPQNWRHAYNKVDPRYHRDVQAYDYYSIMHYGMIAPGTNNKAFRIKRPGIDERRIGNGRDFTREDLSKIRELYGCRR